MMRTFEVEVRRIQVSSVEIQEATIQNALAHAQSNGIVDWDMVDDDTIEIVSVKEIGYHQ